MRVLTVRQPWALHIIQSGKDVENRVRNVAGSYRGPLAIHAALKADEDALYRLPMIAPNRIPRIFHFGAIIGVVHLRATHHAEYCQEADEHGQLCSEWAEPGVHHLELDHPQMLAQPIPFRGALGMRTLPGDVVAEIRRVGFRALPQATEPKEQD